MLLYPNINNLENLVLTWMRLGKNRNMNDIVSYDVLYDRKVDTRFKEKAQTAS